jgi:hypothetical protein
VIWPRQLTEALLYDFFKDLPWTLYGFEKLPFRTPLEQTIGYKSLN